MPTEDKKPTETRKEKQKGSRPPVRVLRVFLVSALLAATAAAAALYSSRDLLRYVAEERIHLFLNEAGNIDYHVSSRAFHLFR